MHEYGSRKRRVTTPTYRPDVGVSKTAERQSAKRAVDATIAAFCPYGDPYCPCQDGDPCHYEGDDAMKTPFEWTFG